MFLINLVVIFCMLICLVISLLLIKIIRDHIRNQSPASVTIIDLTYSDCLASSFCFGIIYSSGIIGCLISEDLTLNFVPALILGELMFISVCYILCALSVTGQLIFPKSDNSGKFFGVINTLSRWDHLLDIVNKYLWYVNKLSLCIFWQKHILF